MTRQRFVARQAQLDELHAFLDRALQGQGQVAFVVGEAGSGKTALGTEFAGRAEKAHGDLVVAIGNCNAQTGIGDPYLPFREILAQLTGDFESKLAQGAITAENAHRLRGFVRWSCNALMEFGPDLINTVVPGTALIAKAGTFVLDQAGWLDKFEKLVKSKPAAPTGPALGQSHIFEQYTNVLRALSGKGPLVLVLDDLQWADSGSTSLLFHLGRRIGKSRILVLGAYRPEEVKLGRGGERHPLEKVLAEFKRYFGDVWVDLDQAEVDEARQFVDALLDLEPNRLGDGFRRALVHHTGGHPLFAVELLRDMQEQGDLEQDAYGFWVEGKGLDWDSLPPRVEGVIEERIGRLEAELQETLTVGSVEGEAFTAEVIARVRAVEQRDLVRRLSKELDKQHHLVVSHGIRRLGTQPLSSYRFRHNLFQTYLYNSLDEVQKAYLHEDVGNVLEALYGDQVAEIAVQLARHFQGAGITEKAEKYLRQAGDVATRLHALAEARQHYAKALDALAHLPDTAEIRRRRVDTIVKLVASAWRSDPPEENLTRLAEAERLVSELPGPDRVPNGDQLRLARVHLWMGRIHYVRGVLHEAIGYYQRVLPVAQASDDAELLAIPSSAIGQALAIRGHYGKSAALLEESIPLFERTGNWTEWVRAMSFHGVALAMMGRCGAGVTETRSALARAREMDSLAEIAMSNLHLILIYLFSGDLPLAIEAGLQTVKTAERSGDQVYTYLGQGLRGWAEGRAGRFEAARISMARSQAAAQELGRSLQLVDWLAVANAEIAFGLGRIEEALALAEQAVDIAQEMGGTFAEGLARRVWGQALAALTPPCWDEAEVLLAESVGVLQSGQSWLAAARTHVAWGIVCRDRGDIVGAREHWEKAAAQWEESELPWELEKVKVLMGTLRT
jgi:tetratricopeptide (TPR) repeat protein